MSVVITQRPSISNGSNTSKFNASANPILYKMTRQDFTWTALVTSGGKIQITIAGNVTANFVVGNTCWLQSNDGLYSMQVTVFSSAFGASTNVVFNEPYVANNAGGYINTLTQRSNYYIAVEIYDRNANILFSYLTASPTKTGLLKVDVSDTIHSLLSPDNVPISDIYSGIDSYDFDNGIYTYFYIKYTEIWLNSANAQIDDSFNKFIAVFASRQIGNAPYGGNMFDYVSFNAALGTPGKWLTRFARPKMWLGYPFSISILFDNDGFGTNGFYFVFKFTSNTGVVTTFGAPATDSAFVTGAGLPSIYRISPNGMYHSFFGVNIPSTMVFCTIQMFNSTSGLAVSEIVSIDIIDGSTLKNQVNVWWRNSLGGDSFFLFNFNQDVIYNYDATKNKRLTLYATFLSDNEWDTIQEMSTLGDLYNSPIVEFLSTTNKTQQRLGQQVYIIDVAGNMTGVVVIPNEYQTESVMTCNSLQMVIELPEYLSQ